MKFSDLFEQLSKGVITTLAKIFKLNSIPSRCILRIEQHNSKLIL